MSSGTGERLTSSTGNGTGNGSTVELMNKKYITSASPGRKTDLLGPIFIIYNRQEITFPPNKVIVQIHAQMFPFKILNYLFIYLKDRVTQ